MQEEKKFINEIQVKGCPERKEHQDRASHRRKKCFKNEVLVVKDISFQAFLRFRKGPGELSKMTR